MHYFKALTSCLVLWESNRGDKRHYKKLKPNIQAQFPFLPALKLHPRLNAVHLGFPLGVEVLRDRQIGKGWFAQSGDLCEQKQVVFPIDH